MKQYQDVIQVAYGYLKTVGDEDGGQALSNCLKIPVTYDPQSLHEFNLNGKMICNDDSIIFELLTQVGVDPECDLPGLIHETFKYHDEDALVVLSFLFDRSDFSFQENNGVIHLISGINGPKGTCENVIQYIYG